MTINRPPQFDPLRFAKPAEPSPSRQQRIAEIAYYRAQKRNFEPGHEVEDWLAAEAVIDQRDANQ